MEALIVIGILLGSVLAVALHAGGVFMVKFGSEVVFDKEEKAIDKAINVFMGLFVGGYGILLAVGPVAWWIAIGEGWVHW